MKKISIILFLFIFFAFLFVFKANAQTPPAQASQLWKCMRGDSKTLTFSSVGNTTVSQTLYADGFLSDTVYLVVCVGTTNGSLCTTGNSIYDKLVFSSDNTTKFPYQISFAGGSKQTPNLGKVSSSATIATAGITGGLSFYAVEIGDITQLNGAGPGLKQSTFSYGDPVTQQCVTISWTTVFPPPPISSSGGGRNAPLTGMAAIYQCINQGRCRYDPFGIVFDSRSLEPLPNVTVTILDENKNKYSLLGLTNPQTTKDDGLFTFLVEPGTYYLQVSEPAGYTFTATPNLQPNYGVVYHKEDGTNSIYKPNEPITEGADMEHRDIPLDSGANPPYNPQPMTISYSAQSYGGVTTILGKVSLPFTYITFSQGDSQIIKIQADRFGNYEEILDNSKLQSDQDIVVAYQKVDLTTITVADRLKNYFNSFLKLVFSTFSLPSKAQTHLQVGPTGTATPSPTAVNGFKLSPILSYLEGYAYNKEHAILPLATILLKLNMNNAIVYRTTADDKGYFIIYPKNIPIFPYYLEIVPPNGAPIDYSTSEFAQANKDYLTQAKINLSDATKVDKPVATDSADVSFSQVDPHQISFQKQTAQPSVKPVTAINSSSNNNQGSMAFLFIAIILLCLIVVGVLVFAILKNKNGRSFTSP